MAAEPKEGVDFEWVEVKNSGGTAKTRRFFSAKEKKAKAEPAAASEDKPSKAKPKTGMASSIRPKARPEVKKEEEAPKKKGLSFGNIKATKEAPRSMGKTEEEPKTADVGVGALVAGGAMTAAAIAARKKARTSTTTPIKKAPESPKGKGQVDPSRRRLLGLAAKAKPTVTAPTEAPKGKSKPRRGAGGAVGGSKVRGAGGSRGIPATKFDPLNLGLYNKGGVVKKKKC